MSDRLARKLLGSVYRYRIASNLLTAPKLERRYRWISTRLCVRRVDCRW